MISARYRLALLAAAPAALLYRRRNALAAGAEYLWGQQADDGGWHSTAYGLLRSGQSLTAFVLDALLRVDERTFRPPKQALQRALGFLQRHTSEEGAVGVIGEVPDYPNYATALAVQAYVRARRDELQPAVRRMTAWLLAQQFGEANGWSREQAAFGGWGMGGEVRRPPYPGHVDLSMTRHVLASLQMAGVPLTDAVYSRARVYLERLQNLPGDGGFFFSTTEEDTNKAGLDGRRFRSYGTTTADGIRSLRCCGYTDADPRVTAARAWLEQAHTGFTAPGFVGEAYRRWPAGLRFYYASATAGLFGMTDAIEQQQQADGSWRNEEALVKEDDPLIATGFAIQALAVH
ncbi:MAG: terpene cyclase/mutase family protein [Bryobacterales bacterium]|nr:terpene cyclase/mutase family protein [Bryobacterales bacterium]